MANLATCWKACSTLIASLALVSKYGTLGRACEPWKSQPAVDSHDRQTRRTHCCPLIDTTPLPSLPKPFRRPRKRRNDQHHLSFHVQETPPQKVFQEANLPATLLHINLVPQNHKRKGVRIPRSRLLKELVSPAVQRLETFQVVDVKDEDTAIGSTVKRNSE